MIKRLQVLSLLVLIAVTLFGQVPVNYYKSVEGKSKVALKTAFSNIIKVHNSRSYANLWTDFQKTDATSDGYVWDMYSKVKFTFISDQCGNYSNIGDCYNREHSFPKSWFGGEVLPMYTDLFHLYPTDGKVNAYRSNYAFGETSTGTVYDISKLGPCTFPGYTGMVFEPADEYKGDFARTYFYMVTCYEDKVPSWNYSDSSQMLNQTSYPCFKEWAMNLLLKWSRQDPVSDKEIKRNEAVYKLQKNRNPFIDYPQLAEYIWGTKMNKSFVLSEKQDTGVSESHKNVTSVSNVDGSISVITSCPSLVYVFTSTGSLLTTINVSDKVIIPISISGVYIVKIIDVKSVKAFKISI